MHDYSVKPPSLSMMSDNLPAHILVVDDDERLRQLLERFLQRNAYWVSVARDVQEAQKYLAYFHYDAIILDVMMPRVSGVEFVEDLRKRNLSIPVLMLSAQADTEARILGLDRGADDYLGKPFEPRELLLRIQNLLKRTERRSTSGKRSEVHFGPFLFNWEKGSLMRGDQPIFLTEVEQNILGLLAQNINHVVSRDALNAIGMSDNERTTDVRINRLRRKLEADPGRPLFLQTIRGVGYRLCDHL
jgi:two-component system phosphate regulon response regulator OmpR